MSASTRVPARLAPLRTVAAWLHASRDFPGRDTLQVLVKRALLGIDADLRGEWGGGLRFAGNPSLDSSIVEPLKLAFGAPALAPVLDASLRVGDTFVDIGANIGVYALWAARLVGAAGHVFAFEPVPSTRALLERNVAENDFAQIDVVPRGVGAQSGSLTLHAIPGASGLSSQYVRDAETSIAIEVEVVTLDDFFRSRPRPRAMKIDVEGMEIEVLRGASSLLADAAPPAIVFEAHAPHFERAGSSYAELCALLRDAGGYRVHALGVRGPRPEPLGATTPGSGDVLAVRPGYEAHDALLDRLSRVRFQL